ncbi:MAG: Ig-like domain-containing protein [Fulvivirga sp.]|uniref:Ig-like domain-containing protein n=1 Tax=Fulvivirga sp. TaxID=1931237 RepID=UPI0032EF6148
MKTYYYKLLFIIPLLCLFADAVGQNISLFNVSDRSHYTGVDCNSRKLYTSTGGESTDLLLSLMDFGVGAATIDEITVTLSGNFTADDLDNSVGGALFLYRNKFSNPGLFDSYNAIQKISITGPGTYTFTTNINANSVAGNYKLPMLAIGLRLKPDASKSHVVAINAITGSHVDLTSGSVSGNVPVFASTTEPFGEPITGGAVVRGSGFLTFSFDANDNDKHRLELLDASQSNVLEEIILGSGETSATFTGLATNTQYYVKPYSINTISGCDIERTSLPVLYGGVTCFDPPTTINASVTDKTHNYIDLNLTGKNPNSKYKYFVSVRPSANPRVQPTDGTYYANNSSFTSGTNMGSGNIALGTVYEIFDLAPDTWYFIDAYQFQHNQNIVSQSECIVYSAPRSILVRTCPAPPSNPPSGLAASLITQSTVRINWTAGSGSGRMVTISENNLAYNVDGLEFSGNTDFNLAPQVSQGNDAKVVYNGTGSQVNVTGLQPGTQYFVRVNEFSGNGDCRSYNTEAAPISFTTGSVVGDVTVATTGISNRTSTSLVIGGDVSINGNPTILAKGIVWTTSAGDPTVALPTKTNEGTSPTSFSSVITGLTPETSYGFRAYVTTSETTNYGTTRYFSTLPIPPTGHATAFTVDNLIENTPINFTAELSWNAAPGADGYMLLYTKNGEEPPIDFLQSNSYTLPPGVFIASSTITGTTYDFNFGASGELTFKLVLVPYNLADNGSSANYLLTGTPARVDIPIDTQIPLVTSRSPNVNATNVSVSSNLVLSFSELIQKGSGAIEIRRYSDDALFESINVSNAAVSVSAANVTINPTSDLNPNVQYYVLIPQGAITDLNENPFAGFTIKQNWRFTTGSLPDNTLPTLTELTPQNGATDVDVLADPLMEFSEPVTAGVGNFTIKRVDNGNVFASFNANDQEVVFLNNIVGISKGTPFPANTEFYIEIDNDAVLDLSGNAFAGISNNTTWRFTTAEAPDVTRPTFVSLSPADGTTDVPVNTTLEITFDEPLQPGSGGFVQIGFTSNGSITQYIHTSSGNIAVSGNTISITLESDLPDNQEYFVSLHPGIASDLSGNVINYFVDYTTWNFTTAAAPDGDVPVILSNSYAPAKAALNIPFSTDLAFEFNEPVLKGTGNIKLRRFADNAEIQSINVLSGDVAITNDTQVAINLATLSEGQYYVEIPATAFKDANDNFFPGILNKDWSLTTIGDPPGITAFSPVDGATEVPLTQTMTITFDEPVKRGTSGSFLFRRLDNNAIVYSLAYSDPRVSFSGNQMSMEVELTNPVFYETDFYVMINGNFATDLAGNTMDQVWNNTTWNVRTVEQPDGTPPSIIMASRDPQDNASPVSVDGISFEFNENVVKGSGFIRVKNYDTDETIEVINVSAGQIEITQRIYVSVSFLDELPEGNYYLEMDAGAFEDEAGNNHVGISNKDTWNFTVLGEAPEYTSLSPAINTTNVPVDNTYIITFNEPIVATATGRIYFRRVSNNNIVRQYQATDPNITISGNVLSVEADLTGFESTQLYLEVQSGPITDLVGNLFTQLNNNTWQFTLAAAPDVTAPLATSFTPTPNVTDIAADADLTIQFNEAVQKGSGLINIRRYSDDLLLQTIGVQDAAVSVNGQTVTINPPDLIEDTRVWIEILEGTFTDMAGNVFAGLSSKSTWNYTPVVENPTIIHVDPADGTTGIKAGQPITFTATFSEPVQAGTGGNIGVLIYNSIGGEILYDQIPHTDLTYSNNQFSFEYTFPYSESFSEREFFFRIPNGIAQDLNGNNMTGGYIPSIWHVFLEEIDTTTPYFDNSNQYPSNGQSNVPYDVVLRLPFTEPIQKGTGNVILRDLSDNSEILRVDVASPEASIDGNTLVIDPGQDIPEIYEVGVELESGIVEDLFGNPFDAASFGGSWSFHMLETPLQIVSVSPPDDALNVLVGEPVVFEVTFDAPIELTGESGWFAIRLKSGGVTYVQIFGDDPSMTVSGNKLFVPITLPNVLDTELYVQMTNNLVRDVNGYSTNPTVGASTDTWNFTTELPSPPQVVSFTPANGTTGLNGDENLVIEFNEPVVEGNMYMVLYQLDPGSNQWEVFNDGSSRVTINDNVVTIDPTNDLPAGREYYFRANSQSFFDIKGAKTAQLGGNGVWNFTVGEVDFDPPIVQTFVPAQDAVDVPIDIGSLSMTFDEPILDGDPNGAIRMYEFNTNALVKEFNFQTADVTVSGNTYTLNDVPELDLNKTYYVQNSNGNWGITDLIGNVIAGWGDSFTWQFTTEAGDVTPPTVLSTSPADDATGVAPNVTVTLTFNEPVGPASPNGVFLREEGSNNGIAATISISGNVLTIDPDQDLNTNQGYYVEIQNNQIFDQNSNAFAGINDPTTFNFFVGAEDNTPPTVVSFNPADNATDVSVDVGSLTITFSEDIKPGNAGSKFRLRKNDGTNQVVKEFEINTADVTFGTNTVTLNNVPTLDFNTGFWVQNNFGVTVYDLADNPLANWNTTDIWNFTTEGPGDTQAPSIVSVSPSNGASNVPVNTNLTITFDEEVQFLSNSSFLIKLYGGTVNRRVISYNSSEVNISGNTITINPNTDLIYDEQYWIRINPGTIGDLAGNAFAGYTSQNDWNFTMEAPPKQDQTITFDRIADKTFGDAPFTLSATASSGLDVQFSLISGPVSLSGNEVTITGVGTVEIAANQPGNGSFNPAPEVIRTFEILKANQTISFDPIADKTFGDAPFNLNASTSSGLTVSYVSSNTSVATVSGNIVTIVGAGISTITASQAGNGQFNPATSVEQTLNVNKANQTISVDPISDKLVGDAPFEVVASTTSGLSLDYQILSGPASISGTTITLNGSTGTVEVEVSQAGNSNLNAASETVSFVVSDPAKTDQTITFGTIEDKTFGDADFTLQASASSGLTVDFSVVSGPISINGNIVTINGAGTATVAANQGGDNQYNPAPEVTQTFTIDKATQTITFDDIEDQIFGVDPFTISAVSSAGLGVEYSVVSGPISLSGATVSVNGTGVATIAANQSGNDNYLAATEVIQSFTIAKSDQTITIEPIADKLTTDDPFNVIATTTSGLALTYQILSGPASISGATISLDGQVGNVVIRVSQAGNSNYNSAEAQINFDVVDQPDKQDQTITFEPLVEVTFGDPDIQLTATASSGLVVTYTSSDESVATVNGSTVKIIGAGITNITASQAGDDDFNAAVPVAQVLIVNKAAQTITFNEIEDQFMEAELLELSATSSSGLIVEFSVASGPAFLNGTTLIFDGIGQVTVEAIQPGNENFESALVSRTFEIISVTSTTIREIEPVSIYPNPANNQITLTGTIDQTAKIFISDMKGNLVRQIEPKLTESIDVSDLTNGIYLILIKGENEQMIRFIKK